MSAIPGREKSKDIKKATFVAIDIMGVERVHAEGRQKEEWMENRLQHKREVQVYNIWGLEKLQVIIKGRVCAIILMNPTNIQ